MDCNVEAYERYLVWEREKETQDRQVAKGIARTIFYLCAFDAMMTCIHIARGGIELNPVMAKAISEFGLFWGMVAKLSITMFCLRFLVKYHNYRPVNETLCIILLFHLGLAVYHLYLFHVSYYG